MASIAQIIGQIRTAIFGKDVRENIALGIEKCYTDVSAGVTTADTAAERANTAAARSESINTELGDNVDDLVIIQQTKPNPIPEFNKIWIKPEGTEYVLPTMDDVATVAETATYLGIPELELESDS